MLGNSKLQKYCTRLINVFREKLKMSVGICSGLSPQGIVVDNPCLLRGLSVAHKYTDPALLRDMFRLAVSEAECSEKE